MPDDLFHRQASSEARLGDIAQFIRGITFKPDDVVPATVPTAVWCFRTKNVQAELDLSGVWGIPPGFVKRAEQFVIPGDILVSSANSWNLIGKCCPIPDLPQRATFGGFVSVLRGNAAQVDARYLYRWFSSDPVQAKLRSFGRKTTNISNLDMGRSLDLKLLLPSLVEQRRIAAILDQADALRAKRRAALAQLDEMARAIFVEKFGDLAPQSCKWPRQAFEQIVTDARIGLVRSSSDIGPEHPHRYLKMDAIGTNGDLDLARATRTFAGAEEVRAYSLAPGDFLFNTRNSRELVGKSAIFRSRVPHLFNNNIMRIRFCKDVAADYVLAAARTPALQREIETKKSGTTSVFAIYWKDLKTLQVPIPPKTLQADFVERMEALRASAEIQKRQGAELDGLFTSLQHRAFRGEL